MAQKITLKGLVSSKPKRSSSSGNSSRVKFSSMNKRKKANYKKYKGQGR